MVAKPSSLDPFEAADAELKAFQKTEKAAGGPADYRTRASPFMTDLAAYELQRSIRALGIVLMRAERTVAALSGHVVKMTTTIADLATVTRALIKRDASP